MVSKRQFYLALGLIVGALVVSSWMLGRTVRDLERRVDTLATERPPLGPHDGGDKFDQIKTTLRVQSRQVAVVKASELVQGGRRSAELVSHTEGQATTKLLKLLPDIGPETTIVIVLEPEFATTPLSTEFLSVHVSVHAAESMRSFHTVIKNPFRHGDYFVLPSGHRANDGKLVVFHGSSKAVATEISLVIGQ